jgi:hypothetical protein
VLRPAFDHSTDFSDWTIATSRPITSSVSLDTPPNGANIPGPLSRQP